MDLTPPLKRGAGGDLSPNPHATESDKPAFAQSWRDNLPEMLKLERLYKVIFAKLPKNEKPLRPFLRNQLYQIHNMELTQKQEKPFDHPYYWAAFTLTGGYKVEG